MFKEVLRRCAVGALFGVTLSQLIAIIISLFVMADGDFYAVVPSLAQRMNSEITAAIVQTVCSFLYGAVFGGMSMVWELDNWSILKQTIVHFSVVSVVTMPIAYVTEWMPHSVTGAILYFAIFAVSYVFIWLSQYIAIKKRIDEMNKKVVEMA